MTKFSEVAHLYFHTQCLLKRFDNTSYFQDTYGKLFQAHNGTSIESLRPILRPLQDITEEESEHINHEIYGGIGDYFGSAIKKGEKYVIDWRLSSEVVLFLLKQSFDIFGLIESGEAINKTTL